MINNNFKEHESVEIKSSIYGNKMGANNESILLPVGSVGTVVFVYNNKKE